MSKEKGTVYCSYRILIHSDSQPVTNLNSVSKEYQVLGPIFGACVS